MKNQEQARAAIVAKMQGAGLSDLAINGFLRNYENLVRNSQASQPARLVVSPVERLLSSTGLSQTASPQVLAQTVVFKLNGGLGTSMGLNIAKSLLPVRGQLSFLDIIVKQILYLRQTNKVAIPLVLMNSFSTENDTLAKLREYRQLEDGQRDIPFSFLQGRVPKIRQDNLQPVSYPSNPDLEWCPPGHGDFYLTLADSGLLSQLLASGFKYAFVANADNLGATLDQKILAYFAEKDLPFLMEVTERTEADRKGGHIARNGSGSLCLREAAQCAPEEMDDFQDIRKYHYFNTNNLWINLQHLSDMLQANGDHLDLPLIINRKPVNPQDKSSQPIYQLETAMGAAISSYPGASAVDVPRTRFAPVKTTNDLLVAMSDNFLLDEQYHLVPNPRRRAGTIVVDLDPDYYRLLDDFNKRFPAGAPSLLKCTSLHVRGDVLFPKGLILAGSVVFENPDKRQQMVAKSTETKES